MTSIGRRLRPSALMSNSLALMGSTIASSGLGFAFWIVAAHLYPADQVGRVSAEVASVGLIASVGQITLTSVLARFLPIARKRTGTIIRVSYGLTLAATWLLACGFIAFGFGSNYLPRDTTSIIVFVSTALVYAVFALEDVVMTSLRKATWVLGENIFVTSARLALLPAVLVMGKGVGVLGAWASPMIIAVIVVNIAIFRKLVPHREAQGSDTGLLPTRRELVNFSSAQFISGIIGNFGNMLPPILVAGSLGTTANAVFYFPWQICLAITTLLWNIVFALIVEAMHDTERTRPLLRRAAFLVMGVTCVLALIVGLLAGFLLGFVGPEYRASGTVLLQLVALSLPFIGVFMIYHALVVIDRRMWFVTGLSLISTVGIFILGGWWLSGRYDVGAYGLAFLVSNVFMALFAVPGIFRRYRRLVSLDKTVLIHLDRAEMTESLADARTQLIFMSLHATAERHRPKHALDDPEPRRLSDSAVMRLPRALDDTGMIDRVTLPLGGAGRLDAGPGARKDPDQDPEPTAVLDLNAVRGDGRHGGSE